MGRAGGRLGQHQDRKREAPFEVGHAVSALWPGDKKTEPSYYDGTVTRIDMETLRGIIHSVDEGATGCAVSLVQIVSGHGKQILEDGTVTSRRQTDRQSTIMQIELRSKHEILISTSSISPACNGRPCCLESGLC